MRAWLARRRGIPRSGVPAAPSLAAFPRRTLHLNLQSSHDHPRCWAQIFLRGRVQRLFTFDGFDRYSSTSITYPIYFVSSIRQPPALPPVAPVFLAQVSLQLIEILRSRHHLDSPFSILHSPSSATAHWPSTRSPILLQYKHLQPTRPRRLHGGGTNCQRKTPPPPQTTGVSVYLGTNPAP
jgi:hypothetical protein